MDLNKIRARMKRRRSVIFYLWPGEAGTGLSDPTVEYWIPSGARIFAASSDRPPLPAPLTLFRN